MYRCSGELVMEESVGGDWAGRQVRADDLNLVPVLSSKAHAHCDVHVYTLRRAWRRCWCCRHASAAADLPPSQLRALHSPSTRPFQPQHPSTANHAGLALKAASDCWCPIRVLPLPAGGGEAGSVQRLPAVALQRRKAESCLPPLFRAAAFLAAAGGGQRRRCDAGAGVELRLRAGADGHVSPHRLRREPAASTAGH